MSENEDLIKEIEEYRVEEQDTPCDAALVFGLLIGAVVTLFWSIMFFVLL